MGAILWNQPAHEQDVPAGHEPVLRQISAGRHGHRVGTVRDVRRGRRTIPGEVILLDPPGVGDDSVWKACGPALGGSNVPPREGAPLLALPVEPIDIENYPLAGQTRDPRHDAAADVEEQGDVVPLEQRVDGREQAVRDGVEMLAPDGRELDLANPAIRAAFVSDVGNTAIDGDVVPTGSEPGAQLFDARLEPAVAGRHAPRAQHANADHGQNCRAAIYAPR